MALVLIKEDGTGLANANTYAVVADGDAYHEAHLYATAWTAGSTPNKEAALAMATRLIDEEFQFNGFRVSNAQALQWPRARCPDPDALQGFIALSPLVLPGGYMASEKFPPRWVKAGCGRA